MSCQIHSCLKGKSSQYQTEQEGGRQRVCAEVKDSFVERRECRKV